MTKHFCCCIPVRAAVFFFSLLSFIASGLAGAACWWLLFAIQHPDRVPKEAGNVDLGQITSRGKIIVIVAGCIFTLVALISFFGFIGSLARNRRMVKAYSFLTWAVFVFTLVGAGVFLYVVFSGKNLFDGCEFKDANGTTQQCKLNGIPVWQKIVSVVITIAELFIQLYIAVVIRRYVDQLEEGEYSHAYKLASHKTTGSESYKPAYYPAPTHDANTGLLNPSTAQYPYSDAQHSFGNASHA